MHSLRILGNARENSRFSLTCSIYEWAVHSPLDANRSKQAELYDSLLQESIKYRSPVGVGVGVGATQTSMPYKGAYFQTRSFILYLQTHSSTVTFTFVYYLGEESHNTPGRINEQPVHR